MLDSLDAAAVRRWCAAGLAALRRHQGEIDELNVYPVPDGDTGTNLVLTLTSAQQALATELGAPAGRRGATARRARAAADGPGRAARRPGQLRGDPVAAAARPRRRARRVRRRRPGPGAGRGAARRRHGRLRRGGRAGRGHGADRGRRRRGRRRAGATRDDLAHGGPGRRREAAAEALARTPEQLPALARAGVVDAGGRGWCVLLDALVEVVTGRGAAAGAAGPVARTIRALLTVARETGSTEYAYEVQFLLDAAARRGRAAARRAGRARRLAGGRRRRGSTPSAGTWNVHVHVNDVGAADRGRGARPAGRTGSR